MPRVPFTVVAQICPTTQDFGGVLKRRLPLILACLLWLATPTTFSAQTTKAQLEISETLFTVAASLNSCGYDAGLEDSLPLRGAIRNEVQALPKQSPKPPHPPNTI